MFGKSNTSVVVPGPTLHCNMNKNISKKNYLKK